VLVKNKGEIIEKKKTEGGELLGQIYDEAKKNRGPRIQVAWAKNALKTLRPEKLKLKGGMSRREML